MNLSRQKSEGWLDPILKGRVCCHEITWTEEKKFHFIQTGGDLYFHRIPLSGTLPHCHDFSEIIFVNSGGLCHKINGERQKIRAGNLIFLRPDDVHCFLPDDDFNQAEVVLIDFDLELFLSLSIYLENDSFLQQLTAPVLPPQFFLDPAETSWLYSRLLKLNSPAIPPLLRKIKLKILLGELYSRFFIDEVNLLSEAQVPDWLVKLCTLMRKEENFCAGVERMQKLACRTPGHLCKCFQKYLGKTPTDFVNELRISHAARLLIETKEEIIQIADHLNFKSLSRFYDLFGQHYGLSPGAYRKLHAAKRRF